ncbi:MAG: TolC family protein [Bacteroidales bacterium]|nr:TolC family protein [Bacteroidales bacterium]
MKIKYLLLIPIALIQLPGFSQKTWTLEDCITYAHDNNLQIKRQQLQAEIADNNYFQSYLNIAPDINAHMGFSYNDGYAIDPLTNNFIDNETRNDNYSVTTNLNIFNGLQIYNNIKKNQYNTLASIQNVEKEKIELTLEISTAYLVILFQKELLEVNKNQLSVTELQVDRTSKLYEAGSVAKGDLLEIKSQLANEKLNVTNAQNELNLAYLNLTQLLDLDSVGGFNILIPDTVQPDIYTSIVSANEIYADALEYLPHIKRAEYALESYKRDLAIQRGKRSPQLYLSGNWRTGYSSNLKDQFDQNYQDQISGNENRTVSAGIVIPIFNNWQVNNSISNAKIMVSDAELQLDLTKQDLYKQIQQAHNDAVSAKEKYLAASEAANSYRESFKYTEQKFNVGIVNSVEYNIAKNNLTKAESDLAQAKYEYIFQTKILDFYRGIPITL